MISLVLMQTYPFIGGYNNQYGQQQTTLVFEIKQTTDIYNILHIHTITLIHSSLLHLDKNSQGQESCIIIMILLIFAVLALICLVVATIFTHKHQLLILAACVIALVVINLLNQVQAVFDSERMPTVSLGKQPVSSMEKVKEVEWSKMSQEEGEEVVRELLEEEREILGHMIRRWEEGQHSVVSFGELHMTRLKMILSLVKLHSTLHDPAIKPALFSVDLSQQYCDQQCFQRSFPLNVAPSTYPILLISNPTNSHHFSVLKQAYLSHNLTIILLKPNSTPLRYHSLSGLAYHHPFHNDYLPRLLQHHPQSTLQKCAQYRTFDYEFYLLAQKHSLPQLCSQALPSSGAAVCVRRYLREEGGRVPEGWVRECLGEGEEGVVRENGWVGVRKEYYWSGRVNRTGYDGMTHQSSQL